jgi:hypothetical protein
VAKPWADGRIARSDAIRVDIEDFFQGPGEALGVLLGQTVYQIQIHGLKAVARAAASPRESDLRSEFG